MQQNSIAKTTNTSKIPLNIDWNANANININSNINTQTVVLGLGVCATVGFIALLRHTELPELLIKHNRKISYIET